MTTGREPPSDRQNAARFAPKWARDPDQNREARRPQRADGDIWLGDAEEAAEDGFRQFGNDKVALFPPPLEPTVMADAWPTPFARRRASVVPKLAVGGLAVAALAIGVIVRHADSPPGERPTPVAVSQPVPAPQPYAAADRNRQTNAPPGRLAVATPVSAFASNEAAPLGVAVYGAGPHGGVVIGGYPPGSTFSSGHAVGPGAWALSATQADGAAITPPSGFVGAMNLVFELRLPDGRVVDRKLSRLEWSAPPRVASPPATPDPPAGVAAAPSTPRAASSAGAESGARTMGAAELAALLKRGNDLVARGDLVGARLVFERAAQAGESSAALALASTYDPVVLERLGERGLAPNIAMARFWYEKAKELGSKEAPERLEVLVSRSN